MRRSIAPGEPLTLTEKGNFLAADLWAEGIKAHSSQRQTVLRLEYPAYNPEYTDEVALTVIGVSRLKWIGRKNCHTPGSSQHDSDEPDPDDPNFPQGVLMGSDSAEILGCPPKPGHFNAAERQGDKARGFQPRVRVVIIFAP